MEMYQSEAVAHILLVEQVQGFQKFGTGEPELRGIAAALLPLARAAGGQLDADADVRANPYLLGFASYEIQFIGLLHHNENLLAHLLCQQSQFDVRLVLIAVADDDRVALALYGNDGMQFRLRTCLHTEVELTTMRDNLLDHRLHLVDLDGIDHIVLAFVVVLLGSLLKTAPSLLDTVVEDVREAQEHR